MEKRLEARRLLGIGLCGPVLLTQGNLKAPLNYLDGLLERLGISDAIKPKVTRPDTDIVSELVAKGEVELGITVITQILTTPGVELVGPLPPEIQSYVTFAAGVSSQSRVPDAAAQLIRFLKESRAIAVITSQGMEPLR